MTPPVLELHTSPMQLDASTPGGLAALVDDPSGLVDPPHEVRDETLLVDLMASMREQGWQGPPIIVDGEMGLTGSHRIQAVANLWNFEGIEVRLQVITVEDLAERYGIDWDALLEDHAGDRFGAALELQRQLPVDVVDWLGMDLH